MSYVQLDEVRRALVIQLDDERIQEAIDDAEDEALNFLQFHGTDLATAITEQKATSDSFAPTGGDDGNFRAVRRGVILLVQTMVDPMTPADAATQRETAFNVMRPYRKHIGV